MKTDILIKSSKSWVKDALPEYIRNAKVTNDAAMLSVWHKTGETITLNAYISKAVLEYAKGPNSAYCLIRIGKGSYASEATQLDGTYVLSKAHPVDAIVMYTSALSEAESEFASGYFHVRKGVAGILITTEERTVDLLDKAMGLGFNKVVGGNTSIETIQKLIIDETEKLTSRDESAAVRLYDSKVIAVYSAKCGAGKTTTASNLATALHREGKKISVLDVDLSYGDIVSTFSIEKCDTIAELSMERNITPALIKSYLRETAAGPSVICAPNSPENVDEITPEVLQDSRHYNLLHVCTGLCRRRFLFRCRGERRARLGLY